MRPLSVEALLTQPATFKLALYATSLALLLKAHTWWMNALNISTRARGVEEAPFSTSQSLPE